MPSPFSKKLADTALGQHNKYHMQSESDPQLSRQIEKYWKDLSMPFPGVDTAWSAVFVSWCVKTAGATAAEFKFSARHAEFVHKAIQNAQAGTGCFRGYDIEAYAPLVGDIIHNNRKGNKFTFKHAATNSSYESHSAIVVETGEDANGKYALTVGGNESDSVRRTIVRLQADGRIKQRAQNPFIAVIQNLK